MPDPTPYAALQSALRSDPSRPLITYLGPQGRTELSVKSFENAVAKAAGLLRDDLDVQPGDRVALLLPVHWQTSIWLGACWATGAIALLGGGAGPKVALTTADRLDDEMTNRPSQAEQWLRVTLHPFGMPSADPLPPTVMEAALEVRAHADVFVPYSAPTAEDTALTVNGIELTMGQVMTQATQIAAECGLHAAGRLLVTASEAQTIRVILAMLAVPLAVAAHVVLAPNAEAETVRTEGITARL